MRNFLLGVLVGVTLMGGTWVAVDTYKAFNDRVSRIEGYLSGLDMMLRQMR